MGRAAGSLLSAPRGCVELPLADCGEGTLEVLGGANRSTRVCGPLGQPVQAAWRLEGTHAVIEMSRASGLVLAGRARGNDPLRATTRGTGELIRAAIDVGATTLVVALGGSATTDGGLGAVEVLRRLPDGVSIVVAWDVQTAFLDAATRFAP